MKDLSEMATGVDAEPTSAPVMPPENRQTQRTKVRSATVHLILGALGIIFLAPMLWLFLASIDKNASWGIEWPHFSLCLLYTSPSPRD